MAGDAGPGAAPDPGDPQDRLARAGAAIVAGVEAHAAGWVVAQVTRIADAWGRLEPEARRHLDAAARRAAPGAAARVVGELRVLLAQDPADQRRTPLEVVRTLAREPTALLREAGIPPVARDPFDERAEPDDDYDLAPRTLGDLGDPDLAPLHLAWGMAKAAALRARPDTGS